MKPALRVKIGAAAALAAFGFTLGGRLLPVSGVQAATAAEKTASVTSILP